MAHMLSELTVGELPPKVAVPQYDRESLSPGIVHIGVGNFHRAHQARYLDRLFECGIDHDWAIIGAGIKPHDQSVRSDLEKQNWLTTIVELDPDGLNARVCGSMIDYIDINTKALIEALCKSEVRIVSLTITEGGYFVDALTDGFDLNHPDIQYDIANPENPQTVFGCIVAALSIRRQRDEVAFTIMSCDNLPENGDVTKAAILGLASAISVDLGVWIQEHAAFPNGMVDCITPATSDRERQLVEDNFGVKDARPVVCEPFRQWVVEDKFSAGRPALEKVGVEFVDNVAPYELMKLRILNGGHAAIAYPAGLLGIHFVHDAMAHPLISKYLQKLAEQEIIPTIPEITGVDFAEYFDCVTTRFSNPAIGDTISRLCLDGSNRQPKFILPTVQDRLNDGLPIEGLALELALWCRYCYGVDEAGDTIFIVDENASILEEHARLAKKNADAFLDLHAIFGDLHKHAEFRQSFSRALEQIWTNGTEAALKRYIES